MDQHAETARFRVVRDIGKQSYVISERYLTSTQWTVYSEGTKRTTYSDVPTSDTTAETVAVDGFAISRKDNTGITTAAARHYSAEGISLTQTNGRGNATATETDKAGRTARKGSTVNDTFAYNTRSELTEATVSGASYSYAYDKAPDGCKGDWTNLAAGLPRRGEGAMGRARINIGNRKSAHEAGHLVGQVDGYYEADGRQRVRVGYNGDEMMTAAHARVTQGDIDRLTANTACKCNKKRRNSH